MKKTLCTRMLLRLSALGLAVATTVNLSLPSVAMAEEIMPNKGASQMGQTKTPKTNVIYIVLDDMGFSDLGCYGSEISTPNINELAANGLRYNNFTTCPVCSPTRASLLTGRDNHAVGMGNLAEFDMGFNVPSTRGRITDKAATVAQILKENGFSTLAVGKWHVAPGHQLTSAGPFNNWPLAKGFERFYGYLNGETDQYDPELVYDNHIEPLPKKKGYQLTSDLVDMAKQFVTDQVSVTPDKPFFLYLAFSATHSPLQAPKEYIDRYNGVYDKGWDQIRQKRFERQKQIGLIPANAELTSRDPEVQAWENLSPEEKKVSARFEQTFAGYLTFTDEQIGRLIQYLKDIGQYDNTMIVLISDNGASGYGRAEGSDYFFRLGAKKGEPSRINEFLHRIEEFGGSNFEAFYPRGWANVSDTPFKGYKGSVYAGGTREPLIISWPNGIQTHGEVRNQAAYVTDITPTVLDVLNITAPDTYQGIEQMPMHGSSLASTFDNEKAPTQHPVHYNLQQGAYQGNISNRSITRDGWKAVCSEVDGAVSGKKPVWELYNLNEDFSETHNLADQYPDKMNELKDLWEKEAIDHGAVLNPKPGRNDATNNRDSFKYFPGMHYIVGGAVPRVFGNSFTITVPISRSQQSQEGALVAHGDEFAGYSFYVQNNQLIFEFIYYGDVMRIVSTEKIPVGAATLKFEFAKSNEGIGGIGRIFINGSLVGEKEIPKVFMSISSEGLSVGRDSYSSVSQSYRDKGEFPFEGKFEYVLYEREKGSPNNK